MEGRRRKRQRAVREGEWATVERVKVRVRKEKCDEEVQEEGHDDDAVVHVLVIAAIVLVLGVILILGVVLVLGYLCLGVRILVRLCCRVFVVAVVVLVLGHVVADTLDVLNRLHFSLLSFSVLGLLVPVLNRL